MPKNENSFMKLFKLFSGTKHKITNRAGNSEA